MSKSRAVMSIALVGVGALAVLTAGPAFAEDPPLVWVPVSTTTTNDGVTVTWETTSSSNAVFAGGGYDALLDPLPAWRPEISNQSGETKYFGFGTDVVAQGTIDPLWTAAAWGAFDGLMDESGLLEIFWTELPDGAALSSGATDGQADGWYGGMPSWSGHTITIFELSEPPIDGVTPTATALASVSTPGRFVAADLSDGDIGNLSAVLGERATVSSGVPGPPQLFAGLTSTVSAAGLTPGEELELWIARDFNYAYFQILGGGLPVGAINVGTGTVASDGTLVAPFRIPRELGWSSGETEVIYQLVVGNRAERYWPAGTYDDFTVKLPPNEVTEISDAGESEILLDLQATPLGQTTATIAYPAGTTAGVTTAIVSPTGPLPDGFTVATNPPLYLHLETTASLGGAALVCISYDTSVVTGAPPRLYHFDPVLDVWVDITTTSADGTVCGEATSFSPFVLGYPDTFDFTGFFAPVSMDAPNLAKPGQAIPVKFSLGGDQGLDVVTSARFLAEGTDSSPDGEPLPVTTAGNSGLSYNASTDTYTYVWKTAKSLSLKTGRFELTLSDGTVHGFDVNFKK